MKPLVLALSVTCAGCAAHVGDTALSGAMIASGGTELNPIGFPGVVAVKIASEVAGEALRDEHPVACTGLVHGARHGSMIGMGATLGGLLLGPPGMVVAGLGALVLTKDFIMDGARKTCFGPRPPQTTLAEPVIPAGWGG
jgi:hypothetical protein